MKYDKIIFLDIDGVLATDEGENTKKKFWYDDKAYPFNSRCVKQFNIILKLTEAQIVLSSSWRLFYGLEELGRIFEFNKVLESPISITPELGDRNLEIKTFVETHDLKNFIIMDDLRLDCYPDKFIHTKLNVGLQKEHIEVAFNLFEKA